ncbi:MAG TPA: phosphate ABC transporter permease PstA [Syntrophorhabdaceae bacterium]|nr:phosphate ABC transporter permease PstA [Syntrophorhabdaceae bacterium]HQM82379.1 phosphate ABC transporter permease PstA [Syntrophorhabdaceae bacterium]
MKSPVERLIIGLSWLSTMALLCAVIAIIGYLCVKGFPSLTMRLIFGDTGAVDALLLRRQVFNGLFPAIAGTVVLVVMSIGWAIPVGIATGIYLAEYAGERVKGVFNLFFDILAGVPSIVIGLFGFALAVFLHKHFSQSVRPCLLISSIALAFLVLPYLIRTTQIAIEGLPGDVRLGALALGATQLQNIFYVLLPRSLSGIMSGVILAIGRCAEDTAVIMLTGVVATAGIPRSLLSNYEALPFYIYYISSQYTGPEELLTGYGASIILLAVCIMLFSAAFLIKRRLTYMAFYRT